MVIQAQLQRNLAVVGVGQPIRRFEDARILAGRSEFLDDVRVDGLAHMAFVRSPHAHARVRAVRGALLTAADLGGLSSPQIHPPPGLTVAPEPHPLLAAGEVRYAGQPVAAVVGESRALAEDAAERVEVDYQPLPAVSNRGRRPRRWRAGRSAPVTSTARSPPRRTSSAPTT